MNVSLSTLAIKYQKSPIHSNTNDSLEPHNSKNVKYTPKRMALRCVCVSVSLCLRVSVSLCLCVVLLFVNICTQIGIFHMGTGSETCDKISKKKRAARLAVFIRGLDQKPVVKQQKLSTQIGTATITRPFYRNDVIWRRSALQQMPTLTFSNILPVGLEPTTYGS